MVVYDSLSEESLVEEDIPIAWLLEERLGMSVDGVGNISSSRITNIDYSLRY